MESILEIKNLVKSYGSGEAATKALNDVSFTMKQGEFTAVMGASGSGKSTLLNLIATIDRATSGKIVLEGRNVAGFSEKELSEFRRDRLGFIFQDYNLLETLTVAENIILPLNLQKKPVKETKKRLVQMAEQLEIRKQLGKFPRQLSGGQRQRAACARALITTPALILADEPTGALDSQNSAMLMKTFVQMNEQMHATILMVTHDASMAVYAGRVLFLKDGRIWKEQIKNGQSNQAFYEVILKNMTLLGGGADAC